jgi:hypothetical protein
MSDTDPATVTDDAPLSEDEEAFAELLGRPRRRGEYHFAFDPDKHSEWLSIVSRALALKRVAEKNPTNAQAQTDAADAEDEVDEAREALGVVSFYFAQIPPNEYDRLLNDHPATKAHRDAFRKAGNAGNLTLNPETFPPALMEKCITKVVLPSGKTMKGITKAQFAALADANFSETELDALLQKVVMVNKAISTLEVTGKD